MISAQDGAVEGVTSTVGRTFIDTTAEPVIAVVQEPDVARTVYVAAAV